METKQRHGCVTAWLIFMIIANAAFAAIYLFAGDMVAENIPGGISNLMLFLLGLLAAANVVFAVLLLKWKRIGFYGFLATSVITIAVNLSIGLGVGQSIAGIIGVIILYGILQIKKDSVTAWDNME